MILQPGDLIEYTPWDKQKNLPIIDERCFAVVTDVGDDFIIIQSARYTCPEVIQKKFFNPLKVQLVSRPLNDNSMSSPPNL